MSKKILGIDLGTGFSCVSVIENGQPKVIFNSDGDATTPSVVSFAKNEIKVGNAALRQSVMFPKETISFIKRFMGEKYDDMTEEIKRVPYNVIKGKNGMACVEVNGKVYTPQEISAMILQKMKKTAEDYCGEEITDAVITCPAYYGDDARQAVKDAGEIAGLNVRRVINEPTAAALSFGYKLDNEKDVRVLVADIGCGTSDFTVLEISSGLMEVVGTNGDLNLGGKDYDNTIIDWIVDEFKKDNSNFDLTNDSMAMQRITDAAQKAKIELSSTLSTDINIPYISSINGTPVHFAKTLTRTKFEQMSSFLTEKIINICKECLKKSKISTSDIDEVLLVGGSTRIPSIQIAFEKMFGKQPNKSVNPDEAVAIGACLQGAILSQDSSVGDILLLDVIPLSLGIETEGELMTKLIDANTTIPTTKSEVFTTATDNQPSVEIVVLQGERPLAKDNKLLGRFHLDGILPAKRGIPQIEVTFDIDVNGIVNVSAKDLGTGNLQSITITSNSNMTEEEIQRAMWEARVYEKQDEQGEELVQLRIDAGNLTSRISAELSNHKKDWDKQMRKEIKDANNALLKAMGSSTPEKINVETAERIREAKDRLMEVLGRYNLVFR